MSSDNSEKKIKVALIQCICPHYRVPLFRKLSERMDLTLFYGRGETKGSWQNAREISGFDHRQLLTLKVGFSLKDHPVRLVWFPGLFFQLWRMKPQAVISEGVTNIVNNVFIWLYCRLFSVPLIIWDSGRKKEKPMGRIRRSIEPINKFIFRRAAAMIAYSSVARDYFLSLGVASEKIFIAQNTIDVEDCLKKAKQFEDDPTEIQKLRSQLKLEWKKVLLYIGALEKRKKIDVLINSFCAIKKELANIALIIIGDGPERQELEKIAQDNHIDDCIFTGKIVKGKEPYFALCDLFVLPGRGGLAINEALAYGKPVIVGEGDGTEADLITDGKNGFIMKSEKELTSKIFQALRDPCFLNEAKPFCREMAQKYDLDNMVNAFERALETGFPKITKESQERN